MHLQPSIPAAHQLSLFSDDSAFGTFAGTDNPRHLRALRALLDGPLLREELDDIAGCSNGPDLIDQLRCRGLEIPCQRLNCTDRDGKPCRPGKYSLSANDRFLVDKWLAKQSNPSCISAIH